MTLGLVLYGLATLALLVGILFKQNVLTWQLNLIMEWLQSRPEPTAPSPARPVWMATLKTRGKPTTVEVEADGEAEAVAKLIAMGHREAILSLNRKGRGPSS